ncbi:hypothetical protein ACJIZ3_009140 [Penstemon smallii]|uniref:C2H2-type domain-containing protein n=1 Tax=Penstemon smallii TaxID=265156 RepID=A0ABD3TBR5_9LAMI
MPVAKLGTIGTPNAMKSEEGNDSLDIFTRQATGNESILPYSRTADAQLQWVQLFNALDQPELPGWPFLTPLKVQVQKCEKCSQEFCSPVNYRRHIRVHRRSLNVNKDSYKIRDLLATFWDKMSLEEAKEVMSFNDVMIKEIPGASVIRALASSLRNLGFYTLPQVYVKAGSTLLDIIQAKPSRLPISSRELFSILDDASEGTFLCAGTAESVKKYVFDGETAKNSLDLKNLVACTCFLIEQQLVKAWIADKDVESLRCQKLLVEEEEAAQRRQAELLERKKQKKLRQKEQKAREQFRGQNGDLSVGVVAVDAPASPETSELSSSSDSALTLNDTENLVSILESIQIQSKELEEFEDQLDLNSKPIDQIESQTIEPQVVGTNDHLQVTDNHWQVPRSQRRSPHEINVGQNLQTSKPEPLHKPGQSKDRSVQNGSKVWTKKIKMDSNLENLKPPTLKQETSYQIEENNSEVIIGSIPITIKSYVDQKQDIRLDKAQENCSTDLAMLKKNAAEKLIEGRFTSNDRCMQSQSTEDSDGNIQRGNLPFCRIAAKEFLERRWKEAISGDHVTLVLSPREPSNAKKQVSKNTQVKIRKKPEKSLKLKYIPKQKAAA